MSKTGRPSSYTEETAIKICEAIMGGAALKTICAQPGMPAQSAVYSWLSKYPEFQKRYSHAREVQADNLVDEIVAIAGSDEDPAKARNMILARQWLAGKLRPTRYGDKLALDHKVESSQGMIVNVNVVPARPTAPPSIDVEPERPALPTVTVSSTADAGQN